MHSPLACASAFIIGGASAQFTFMGVTFGGPASTVTVGGVEPYTVRELRRSLTVMECANLFRSYIRLLFLHRLRDPLTMAMVQFPQHTQQRRKGIQVRRQHTPRFVHHSIRAHSVRSVQLQHSHCGTITPQSGARPTTLTTLCRSASGLQDPIPAPRTS